MVEEKYKGEYAHTFTCKLLFGMNEYPDFSGELEGIPRRIVPLEFKRVFTQEDSDFNPALLDELKSPESMAALLNMAIGGYFSE